MYAVHYMSPTNHTDGLFENLRLELRRGSLILAVLAALRKEQYGYTLRKPLEDQGMPIDEGTLYPSCAASKPRACSSANGARKRSATNGFIASPRKERPFSSPFWRNGKASTLL